MAEPTKTCGLTAAGTSYCSRSATRARADANASIANPPGQAMLEQGFAERRIAAVAASE
jgi:hypothetical protein